MLGFSAIRGAGRGRLRARDPVRGPGPRPGSAPVFLPDPVWLNAPRFPCGQFAFPWGINYTRVANRLTSFVLSDPGEMVQPGCCGMGWIRKGGVPWLTLQSVQYSGSPGWVSIRISEMAVRVSGGIF